MVGELGDAPVKAARGGRKKGPDLSTLVDTMVVGLFGLVATATQHEHWLKEKVDVIAITQPLNAWIDQLPAKTLKKLEAKLAPTLFVVGVATVVGPDAVLEARIRYEQKHNRNPFPRQTFQGEASFAPPERPSNGNNGAVRDAGGVPSWHSGIPSTPPIGSDFDV